MSSKSLKIFGIFAIFAIIAPIAYNSIYKEESGEINVYTYRQPFLMDKVIKLYEEKNSNVKVNMIYMKKGLVKKLLIEGEKTPADVVLLKGYSNINKIVNANMLEYMDIEDFDDINKSYIGNDNKWVAITARSRVIYVNNSKKDLEFIKTYQDLASPSLRGRICIRDLNHSYNKELVAYYAAAYGEKAAKEWFKGLVSNIAKKPSGNDRAQVKFIYQGKCDVAVANGYYYLKMKNNENQKVWLDKVDLVWPNQNDKGAQLNVTVAGVVKYSNNTKLAEDFVKFLTSDDAQNIFANDNGEISIMNSDYYSTNERLSWSKRLNSDKIIMDEKTSLQDAVQNIKFAENLIENIKK